MATAQLAAGMSDEELRDQLKQFGQDVPPITDGTRSTLKKRLAKLMGASGSAGKRGSPLRSSSPLRSRQTVGSSTIAGPAVARTPLSSPSAPAARPLHHSSSPKKAGRSGAAFSSDEEDDVVVERVVRPQTSTSGGTSVRGSLNGQSWSNSISATDSSGGSTSPSRFSSGFGRWFTMPGKGPKTSTPTDKRSIHNLEDSFGAVTPIRDDGVRMRRPLGRLPLEAFERAEGSISGSRDSLDHRRDPIHLTPMASKEQRFTHHSPPRPRPLQFVGRSRLEDNVWMSRSISLVIILLTLAFFVVVAVLYARMKWGSTDLDSRIVRYQLEGRSEADTLYQKSDYDAGLIPARIDGKLYNGQEILAALNIASALQKELAQIKGDAVCNDNEKMGMGSQEAKAFSLNHVPNVQAVDFGNAIDLIVANPHWGIKAMDTTGNPALAVPDVKYLESEYAAKDFFCRLKEAVASVLFRVFLLALGIGLVVALGILARNYWQRRVRHQEFVFDMVNKIVCLVQKNYEQSLKDPRSKPYIAISHIREILVPHGRDRAKLLTVFDEAVKYIHNNESRLKQEVQAINGEEFDVWTWLHDQMPIPQPDSTEPDAPNSRTNSDSAGLNLSNVKARIWSGGATLSVRQPLPEQLLGATSCLKVRGMFNGKTENQADRSWVHDIEDAVLEKCHGVARVLDVRVEPASEEGVVYVKLGSNEDARSAYMALQHQYFDGNLVSVKFLKLERYHQRFPDAIHKHSPLQVRTK
ncbi:LOW QUALITY PROTEIN: inner nuclear membrane protein Man1-like [Paramacrobiotus metropolitanus]|uniref:LOW QUALITY PROTEIN: inner nuclear membrane protein Man1-like n=1 Tax=Paramacrobiotus metropolitanus TaxID=2943436 RepID=UPI00244630E1|nr:LOW QUALITY PROTEIN: inner nuclear membrane protein Man1-like [Paramacrobiotus metropolitanus]